MISIIILYYIIYYKHLIKNIKIKKIKNIKFTFLVNNKLSEKKLFFSLLKKDYFHSDKNKGNK